MITWKQAAAIGATSAAGLLGTLLTAAANDVWSTKTDHEKRITTLEVKDVNSIEVLLEIRQDAKEMRQDIKELLQKVGNK